MEKKALWEILVPKHLDGREILVQKHQIWDRQVRVLSGGLTIMRTGRGEWVSPEGTTISEMMIPVRVCCTAEAMKLIATMTLGYYEQEAVMYYKLSDEVYIVETEEA